MKFLDRENICLLGLPFDAVTMDETVLRVREAVRTGSDYSCRHPNRNFLVVTTVNEHLMLNTIQVHQACNPWLHPDESERMPTVP